MSVHFTCGQMKKALSAHDAWWNKQLHRPLTKVVITDAYKSEGACGAPLLSQATCADFSYSPQEIIDALDAELSKYEFLGDAFPMVNFDSFGPGVLAAMCGARLDNSSGRVWFFPEKQEEICDIHALYDPDNKWSRRIKDIYRAGLEKWQGRVIMGFPDLGGVMDVAATFRGSQALLIDMIDEPYEVLRLIGEIEKAWYAAYEDFRMTLAPQGAYTHWSGLMSSKPSYIIQCDLSYMISGDMFQRFVRGTLERDTYRLDNTIYHLDGIGELTHLDSVLSLEKLNAVQWQYGDGKPGAGHWLDIYRRITDAGKQIWVVGYPKDYLDVISALHGTPYSAHTLSAKDEAAARMLLEAR